MSYTAMYVRQSNKTPPSFGHVNKRVDASINIHFFVSFMNNIEQCKYF
jgi:hypothetical protein